MKSQCTNQPPVCSTVNGVTTCYVVPEPCFEAKPVPADGVGLMLAAAVVLIAARYCK